jgi:hypothetical protein
VRIAAPSKHTSKEVLVSIPSRDISVAIQVVTAHPEAFLIEVLEHGPVDLPAEINGLTAGLIELATRLGVSPSDGAVEGAPDVDALIAARAAFTSDEHLSEATRSAAWYAWLAAQVQQAEGMRPSRGTEDHRMSTAPGPFIRIPVVRAEHYPREDSRRGQIQPLDITYLRVDPDAVEFGAIMLVASSDVDVPAGYGFEFDLNPSAARQLAAQLLAAATLMTAERP